MSHSGAAITARFFRLVVMGLSALLLIFVPLKLLQFMGLGVLLAPIDEFIIGLGAPPALGHLATVCAALVLLAAVGLLLMALIRSQKRVPFLRLFARTAERFDEMFEAGRAAPPRVALVAWPNDDVRTVGVVMRYQPDTVEGEGRATVFIPNSPNPMSGILRVVSLDKLEFTDWTMDDVVALSISRGALLPKSQ